MRGYGCPCGARHVFERLLLRGGKDRSRCAVRKHDIRDESIAPKYLLFSHHYLSHHSLSPLSLTLSFRCCFPLSLFSVSISLDTSIYLHIYLSFFFPSFFLMNVCVSFTVDQYSNPHAWSYHRVIATAPGKRVFPYNITLHSPRTSVSSLNVPIVADTKTFHVCMGSNPLQELRCLCSRKRREEWYLVQFKLLSPEIWNCS